MSQHTEGRWIMGETREVDTQPSLPEKVEVPIYAGTPENRDNCIAIVYKGGPGATVSTREAVEANARLMTASPLLLEAAKKALGYMRLHKYADQAWADDLEAAILEADPEHNPPQ